MKVTIVDIGIENFSICLERDCSLAVNNAGSLLQKYIKKMTGFTLPVSFQREKNSLYFEVVSPQKEFNDGYEIRIIDNSVRFLAYNDRGIVYSVYCFLERLGYRFFSADAANRALNRAPYSSAVEYLFDPTDKVLEKEFSVVETPAFYYRDNFTCAVTRNEDFVKFRLNAETWNVHQFGREWGKGLRFSGPYGHSYFHYVDPKEYFEAHPEYFAEINGKRTPRAKDCRGLSSLTQLCLTNGDVLDLFVEKIKGQLKENYQNFVSVSQNDSELFCTCSACRKEYEKYGYFGATLNFANKVARAIKAEYPEVKVHTFAYGKTADVNTNIKAEDNVVIQLCPRPCHAHALSDPTCKPNVAIYNKLQTLGKISNNIYVYDYRSCLGFSMLLLPDIFLLRDTMRRYAECGVKGIYTEGCIFNFQQPTLEELRLYLFSKLAWNPHMSDEEYHRHIDEFLLGFYGKNGKYIKEFLLYWEKCASKRHIDSFNGSMLGKDFEFLRYPDGEIIQATLFAKEEQKEIIARSYELLEKAEEGAENAEKMRIDMIRTGVLWYEVYHEIDDILEKGTEAEKKEIWEKNALLCDKMRMYCMKFASHIGLKKAPNIFGNYLVPPTKWHGSVNNQEDSEAFNFDSF